MSVFNSGFFPSFSPDERHFNAPYAATVRNFPSGFPEAAQHPAVPFAPATGFPGSGAAESPVSSRCSAQGRSSPSSTRGLSQRWGCPPVCHPAARWKWRSTEGQGWPPLSPERPPRCALPCAALLAAQPRAAAAGGAAPWPGGQVSPSQTPVLEALLTSRSSAVLLSFACDRGGRRSWGSSCAVAAHPEGTSPP